MQGLGFLVVCALAATCVAQTQNTTQTPPQPTGYYPFPFVHPFQAVAQSVYAQKSYSEKWASLILRFQSYSGWSQVSAGWLAMIQMEAALKPKGGNNFEEDEDMVPLMATPPLGTSMEAYDQLERSTEHALLSVIKIMYVQAAHKLGVTQSSHYENKIYLSALQAAGGQQFGAVISIMYYLEVLRVQSSAYTIQRQDAWNTWLVYEILETEILNNSRDEVPAGFDELMTRTQTNAMTAYFHEASNDLQIAYLQYYLQMLVPGVPTHPDTANANHASSFLEEEATAEPAKPFFPFMGASGGNPFMMMNYYVNMLKLYAAIFNYQAAEGLFHFAAMEEQTLHAPAAAAASAQPSTELATQVKVHAISALQQWAYLKNMQVMIEFYTFSYSMMAGPHMAAASASASANAANANAFVQTEAAPAPAPQAPVQPEATAEQKALLDTVVAQFLRPQSLSQ